VMTCARCKRCPGLRMAGFRKFQQTSCITHKVFLAVEVCTPAMPFHTRLADDEFHDLGSPSAALLSFPTGEITQAANLAVPWIKEQSHLGIGYLGESPPPFHLNYPFCFNGRKHAHSHASSTTLWHVCLVDCAKKCFSYYKGPD